MKHNMLWTDIVIISSKIILDHILWSIKRDLTALGYDMVINLPHTFGGKKNTIGITWAMRQYNLSHLACVKHIASMLKLSNNQGWPALPQTLAAFGPAARKHRLFLRPQCAVIGLSAHMLCACWAPSPWYIISCSRKPRQIRWRVNFTRLEVCIRPHAALLLKAQRFAFTPCRSGHWRTITVLTVLSERRQVEKVVLPKGRSTQKRSWPRSSTWSQMSSRYEDCRSWNGVSRGKAIVLTSVVMEVRLLRFTSSST